MQKCLDILYRQVDGIDLYLDLYLPEAERPPLIMWIHGGAWMYGDRKTPGLMGQVARGYAVASIEYRLTGQAIFPANIIDCKHALVWLKAHAREYGYDASRVAVAGDSAGGHLTALMGTSVGQADWEPEGADCCVQAAVDFYGPTDVTLAWENAALPDSPEAQLLGAPVLSPRGRARAAVANPITYVNGQEPPFLILHGDADDTVPYGQSVALRNALEAAGVSVALHRVHGGGHGFESAVVDAVVGDFLDYYLRGKTLRR